MTDRAVVGQAVRDIHVGSPVSESDPDLTVTECNIPLARALACRVARPIRQVMALAGFALLAAIQAAPAGEPKHAIAMHGEPAMPPGFSAMPYVNPDAPKGGRLTQGVLGTFDSLN